MLRAIIPEPERITARAPDGFYNHQGFFISLCGIPNRWRSVKNSRPTSLSPSGVTVRRITMPDSRAGANLQSAGLSEGYQVSDLL